MIRPLLIRDALCCLALLALGAFGACGAAGTGTEVNGMAILEKNCGRCHSIAATGTSPLPQAPPLREVYLKYPIDQLEEGFAEGMGSRHRDMPQIQFSDDQVAAILNYLGSITGVDRASRAPAKIPGETPP
ncbi:MAG TPA: cytochrome c [Methyloceanibacter sp.]|nr:cytochrome c [Methyloceanibacter sp.]